jgi:hypothetical protein
VAEPVAMTLPAWASDEERALRLPTPPPEEALDEEGEPHSEHKKRGRFRLLRRRGQPFLEEPGDCAVCSRELQAASAEELATSGWIVQGEVGLCPNCQEDGWTLPEGAPLPTRQLSEA